MSISVASVAIIQTADQALYRNNSSNMSSTLEHFVPYLDEPNFQFWKHTMHAFLQSQDLWGIVNSAITWPVPAVAAQPTLEETALMLEWDMDANAAVPVTNDFLLW